MEFTVVALRNLLNTYSVDDVKEILNTFKSISNHETNEINDVECFLHDKAINFENMAWATTHLVFVELEKPVLVGYFSFANRPLKMTKKNFEKLSNNQKKKLLKYGRREENFIEINSYLIGQLGKNYNLDDSIKQEVTGNTLLTIAYQMLVDIVKVVNVKYVWIECEDNEKILKFYQDFGFNLIENYQGDNELNVLIMKIE